MSLTNARTAKGRKARHTLDCARNPEYISQHAIDRFVIDLPKDPALQERVCRADGKMIDVARAEIRALCAAARRIYRNKDATIIESPPWFIFYRDRAVITVMHKDSPRKW